MFSGWTPFSSKIFISLLPSSSLYLQHKGKITTERIKTFKIYETKKNKMKEFGYVRNGRAACKVPHLWQHNSHEPTSQFIDIAGQTRQSFFVNRCEHETSGENFIAFAYSSFFNFKLGNTGKNSWKRIVRNFTREKLFPLKKLFGNYLVHRHDWPSKYKSAGNSFKYILQHISCN